MSYLLFVYKGVIITLDKQLAALLNSQINMEFYSAYLYLEIHSYYAEQELNGFANWYFVQTQEERDHALLFVKYLQNNGEKPQLTDVKAPTVLFGNFKEPAERRVTTSINNIYGHAYVIKDFRTMQFLDWFVKEQGEEEKNAETILKKYDLFGNDPKGLYMLDHELGTRVYAPPSLVL